MNQVILAYSRLPRQLPAALRAHWRARLQPARALRLSENGLAQSQSLLGMALACRLLSSASGRPVLPGELRYTNNGKPHAAGMPQFSIAHAGVWILCALCSDGAVGVDIEPLAPRAALPRWLHVFDRQERVAARSALAALSIWTTKEAVLKAAGAPFAQLPLIRVRGREVEFRGQRWHCRAPHIAPRMLARLVTERPVTRLVMRAVPAMRAMAV
ncbi:MAG TPA: 4'-phosphopantetheinyl transferase superfamily protein [Steroidobacteraceae bacterium]|nr:4'-phosphopantetheinyl transferase superfamily protein [Steroidobacteraceae bacterium]